MRALIQRTARCSVEVDGKTVSSSGPGMLLLLGIAQGDGEDDVVYLTKKVTQLRIFEDVEGKMNLSVREVQGQITVVSQFTLVADTQKGNRPGFGTAMAPEPAEKLYSRFVDELEQLGLKVSTGIFGACMKVNLENDGPVTILLES